MPHSCIQVYERLDGKANEEGAERKNLGLTALLVTVGNTLAPSTGDTVGVSSSWNRSRSEVVLLPWGQNNSWARCSKSAPKAMKQKGFRFRLSVVTLSQFH